MKFLVLSLVFGVSFVYADIISEKFENFESYHKECLPKSGVNPELFQKARQGDFVDDEKLKEHIFCISKLFGFQNEAGDIQKDVLQAKLDTAFKYSILTDIAVYICDDHFILRFYNKQLSGPERAFETLKCIKKHHPHSLNDDVFDV
ncbi:B1 protein-like [Diabrotica undecimpunctata]|uniref:B1 protein-like n=1 Tax=Diabrotica undecimpunctata TaxID=50387 RepID=UPI003B63A197